MTSTRQLGDRWERVAESFLNKRGLKTLERNFLQRFGEIDLVMLDDKTIVFAEVRYRGSKQFGSGADSVTWAKQKRIVRAAERFLQQYRQHRLRPCRFDVVSIHSSRGEPILEWIQSAFDASQCTAS